VVKYSIVSTLRKKENSLVEKWLLEYPERKSEYEQKRNELLSLFPSSSSSSFDRVPPPKKKTQFSDPTFQQAALLIKKLDNFYRWLKLVEEVEAILPYKLRLILHLRREVYKNSSHQRERGRPSWIPYVQQKYCETIAKKEEKPIEEVWVSSPSTFSKWWGRIVDFAAREAAKRGLLKTEDRRSDEECKG